MTDVKSVVITGASTGIGAACALCLDEKGYRVFAGVRKQADGEALRSRASQLLTPLLLDVTDAESIRLAAESVAEQCGSPELFGLVNNAGIVVAGAMETLPIDALRRQFEVNFFGHMAVTQTFLPFLRRTRGRIINMGSISGRLAAPIVGPYSASKFALEALSDVLRMELRPWGIQVSIIEPGNVATPIWQRGDKTAHAIDETLTDEERALYKPLTSSFLAAVSAVSSKAVSAEYVGKVVARALSARKPKTRYLVGIDAHVLARVVARLPDRWRDWLILRSFHKSRS